MRRILLPALLRTLPVAAMGLLLTLITGATWGWAFATVCLVGSSIFLAGLLLIIYQLHLFYKATILHEDLSITSFTPFIAFLPYRALYCIFDYYRLNNARNNKEEEHLPPFRFPDHAIKS